jgi:hypothetical protein
MRSVLAALSLAILAGCSSSQMVDDLPAAVGLPADVPARPATPYQVPAVHDMPPPRATEPMSAEDQLKLEKDLVVVRDRQEGHKPTDEEAPQTAKKNPKKTSKKKPAEAQAGEAAGTKTNP